MYRVLLLIFLLNITIYSFELSQEDLNDIANKVYINECSGDRSKLIQWNKGEEFLSLGIGHFIWYPKDYSGIYEESFPNLIKFISAKREVPDILKGDCLWNSVDEFNLKKDVKEYNIIMDFLLNTMDIQAEFLLKRLEKAYENMRRDPDFTKEVEEKFNRLRKVKAGYFILIDYVNFKGDGTKLRERYNGQGWGLLQVLLNMKNVTDIKKDFAESAIELLNKRVENSPIERGESRWLEGWENRIKRYYTSLDE